MIDKMIVALGLRKMLYALIPDEMDQKKINWSHNS